MSRSLRGCAPPNLAMALTRRTIVICQLRSDESATANVFLGGAMSQKHACCCTWPTKSTVGRSWMNRGGASTSPAACPWRMSAPTPTALSFSWLSRRSLARPPARRVRQGRPAIGNEAMWAARRTALLAVDGPFAAFDAGPNPPLETPRGRWYPRRRCCCSAPHHPVARPAAMRWPRTAQHTSPLTSTSRAIRTVLL
jgi:hypothetical protein